MYQVEGKPAGVYPALVQAIFAKIGVPVQLQAKPWVRVLNEMDRGIGGIAGAYRTKERESRWDFSVPLLSENIAVFMRKDADWRFESLSSLQGRNVGTVRGWSYGAEFDAVRASGLLTVEDTQSDRFNLRKLSSGRLDAALAIEEAGQLTLRDMNINNIAPAQRLLISNPVHIAFPKDSGRRALLEDLNTAIAEMKRNGEIKRIYLSELSKLSLTAP